VVTFPADIPVNATVDVSMDASVVASVDTVDRPVTVGVTGTHSTGKSTFLARLAHELRARRIEVSTVADLGEKAKTMGMPILFNHTWASTLWIIARGISNELEAWLHADVVLIDRPVPDALGYYRAALEHRGQRAHPAELEYLNTLVRDHSRRYDLVFRTTLDPSIPIGDNKERDSNAAFRRLADRHIGRVLDELHVSYVSLPADGHDDALDRAIALVLEKLKDIE
jgi:nicotinamide riboside kinase